MARIYIQGWASFEEWKAAGYPGALDAYGNRKGAKPTRRAVCQVLGCDNSMVRGHYCLHHFNFYRAAQRASA